MNAATIQTLPDSQNLPEGASPESSTIALRALQGEGETAYLPLGSLRIDERNVRKDEPTDDEIEALADLIDSQGLLQNLTVVAYPTPVKGKGKEKKRVYTHGVIAGGRRTRALLRLVQRGRITLAEEILCIVVDESRALAISTAENSGRAAMSTADMICAFADMVRAGAGVEELAVCFHLSPLTVQRRLRLANVAPSLFDLFRKGEINVEQLMALALTEDHARQIATWHGAPSYNRSARQLRAMIAGEGVSKSIIAFVTVAAYEAAGGNVMRDLFAEPDDDSAEHITAPDLMMRLATEKLEAIAAEVRAEPGIAWTEQFLSLSYGEREAFGLAPFSMREMTPEEMQSMEAISEAMRTGQEELEDLHDQDDDGEEVQAKIDALEKRLGELESQQDAIHDARRQIDPRTEGLVGALVHLDYQGQVKIERGTMRKTDIKALRSAIGNDHPTGSALPQEQSKPAVSDRLCHQLTAHRTRALQALMLANQTAALAALAHPLLARLLYGPSGAWTGPSALQVRAEDCESQLKTWAPDLEASRAEAVVTDAKAALRARLPADAAQLLPWLLAQPADDLLQMLQVCAALSLNAINGDGKHATTAPLAQALGLDMADWWTPTAASYFGAVSKTQIAEAVQQAGMPEDALEIGKLKKGDAAVRAEELMVGKRWVPVLMR